MIMKKPIFITGLRKSGTSMVKNLLDNHPDLFMYPPNEFHFFKFTHFHNLGRKLKHETIRKKPIAGVIEDVCESKWFNPWKRLTSVDWDGFVDIEQLHALIKASGASDYRELFVDIANAMATATAGFDSDLETRRFTCKGVQQEEFFPELREWFPDLKMIYVLRNPYGQLNSAINNMRHGRKGFEEKLRVGVDINNLDTSFKYPYLGPRLRQMRVSYYFMRKFAELCPNNFYVLKYDDLLLDTGNTMRRLCDFLELEFHQNLLEVTVCGKPVRQMGWSVSQYKDNQISQAPLIAWRKQMSKLAVRLVGLYFEDVLLDYGFGVEESRAALWRKFDPSEDLYCYIYNRLLFTKPVRKLI
jgi:hypothetical protein